MDGSYSATGKTFRMKDNNPKYCRSYLGKLGTEVEQL